MLLRLTQVVVAHVQESSARFMAGIHGACALKLEQVQERVVASGSMLQLLEDAHHRLNASQPADKHQPVKVAALGSDPAAKALGSSFDDRLNARIKEAELLAAGVHTAALTSSDMASQLTALRKLLRLAFVEVSDNLLCQLWPTTLFTWTARAWWYSTCISASMQCLSSVVSGR